MSASEPILAPNPRKRLAGLSPAGMYARLLASDHAYDGRFYAGVLTTGIYCLPSCGARKPKPENVRFFDSVEAARLAGLRPCLKCHPDDFARGADAVLEAVEDLVGMIRRNPGDFSDVEELVKRLGFSSSRAFELFRTHYHATPGQILVRARVDAAMRALVATGEPVGDVAMSVGFSALSTFHDNFRRLTGITPQQYRELPGSRSFEVAFPPRFPVAYLRRALARDPHGISDRLSGDDYTAAVRVGGEPALLKMRIEEQGVRCEIGGGSAVEGHAMVRKLLGFEQDPGGLERLVEQAGAQPLIAGREQMRISQIPSVFDALLWAVIGQQINLRFAYQLRCRLIQRAGTLVEDGLYLPPTADAILRLSLVSFTEMQFSRQKADYLLQVSRQVAGGELQPESLRAMSATRAERTLLSLRGFGPWTANFIMMRSLGFADCLPIGDTGITSGLQKLFNLKVRPGAETTRALMARFAPYRSLATAHLWQLTQPLPA